MKESSELKILYNINFSCVSNTFPGEYVFKYFLEIRNLSLSLNFYSSLVRDLANLERKLQKHEAFERELQANEKQLRNVESVRVLICL